MASLSKNKTIRLFYNEGNPNNRLYRIRGTVDGQLVVRQWLGRRWRYKLLDEYFIEANSKYITWESAVHQESNLKTD